MADEGNLEREKSIFNRARAQKVIENLQKRKMNGFYAENRQEALTLIMEMIQPGEVVARGDGITLDQIGLVEAIRKRGQNTLIDPFQTDENGNWPEHKERLQMMRETFFADIFITGSNAITLDGKIVNIDGFGNRVSAIIYGPSRVILILGVNKIVKDVEEGLQRIHGMAAPMNATRHLLEHHSAGMADLPCVKTGNCADCRQDYRICNYTSIIEGAMPSHKGRINVVLVNEELGL
jgi:L-lactate utilization protein LutB